VCTVTLKDFNRVLKKLYRVKSPYLTFSTFSRLKSISNTHHEAFADRE